MKLNRKWLLVIALVMSLTMATAGTLAYLTDRDSEANVFTVGNVEIDLKEDFQQGATLIPGVNIEKKPVITNTGRNDAWVWLEFAIPAALDNWALDTQEGSNKNVIHWNQLGATTDGYVTDERVNKAITDGHLPEGTTVQSITSANSTWNLGGKTEFSTQKEIEVNGKKVAYNCYIIGYNKVLTPGETTLPNIYKVFLDTRVDIDPEGNWYFVENGNVTKFDWNIEDDGNPIIYVSAYAMQKDGFDTVDEAIRAYSKQWGNNGTEWGEPQMPGEPAPANTKAEYNGMTYDDIYEAVEAANQNGGGTIILKGSAKIDRPVEIASNITIKGEKNATTYTREDGFTGTMFTVKAGATLTAENVVFDGAGATATGNLIATEGNGSIVLNAGTVLQNNNGAHAVSLYTRGGGTLTLNGAQIINNSSDSGAIWGGGHIIVNEGSKINNNSSTGSAGAIRMVGSCNLTMNGGEICNNKAATDGGAIWGYGVNGNTSVYNLNGGKISGNVAGGVGGGIYTGTYSTVNIAGDFEMCNNTAGQSGALRLTNYTKFNMTGGKISGNQSTSNEEWDGFYAWTAIVNVSGGELADEITIQGNHTPTVGGDGITGIIHFGIGTNHNTINLLKDFGTIKFTVAEGNNFGYFNFKPASGYAYTAGDEDKLICMNEGYSTYWDAATGTFRLQAK